MSENLLLIKGAGLYFALVLVLAGSCKADGVPKENTSDLLLTYRTTSTDHGLYEIREQARRFLQRQPRKKSGNWVAVGPDIRMQLALCAVPLRTRWGRASDNKENLPGVLVICGKTIDKQLPNWTVLVSTYIPEERALELKALKESRSQQ